VHFVSFDYLRTLDIRLLSGRELRPDDIAEGRPVAVISRTMARLHWQDHDPIGRRITFGNVGRDGVSKEPWFTIVGVVADVRYGNPEAAIGPQVYVPVSLSQGREVSVLARTSGDPMAASAALQQAVQSVDPDIAVYDARTLSDRLAETTAESRYRTGMLVFFGGLALLLAATGLHGATAGRVAKRRRELALRIAIGATPRGLVRLVLRRTLMVVAIASTAGAIAALLAARWAASRVWGLIETDAAGMSAAILVVLMIGAMAALVPALRAGRVDPMAVLRSE
jgi:ABC-type antimicrobial peptide transport system permease subunit